MLQKYWVESREVSAFSPAAPFDSAISVNSFGITYSFAAFSAAS